MFCKVHFSTIDKHNPTTYLWPQQLHVCVSVVRSRGNRDGSEGEVNWYEAKRGAHYWASWKGMFDHKSANYQWRWSQTRPCWWSAGYRGQPHAWQSNHFKIPSWRPKVCHQASNHMGWLTSSMLGCGLTLRRWDLDDDSVCWASNESNGCNFCSRSLWSLLNYIKLLLVLRDVCVVCLPWPGCCIFILFRCFDPRLKAHL